MREFIIDCSKLNDEADFWAAYLLTTQPEGTQLFGRNFDALWDALSAGGQVGLGSACFGL
jgi:RNAse (barnase) inhibitor barstar